MPEKTTPLILDPQGDLAPAVDVYKRGGVFAYPTETFYGLGADPFNVDAVRRVFSLKGRAPGKPLSVLVSDVEMLSTIAGDIPPVALSLIERFWPGPLTLVLEAAPTVPPELVGGTGKIGVRVSSSGACTRLLKAIGAPLTTTSANPAGSPPPVTARKVVEYFGGSLEVVVDGGTLVGRLGSTVVDCTGGEPVILREGEIPSAEITGP